MQIIKDHIKNLRTLELYGPIDLNIQCNRLANLQDLRIVRWGVQSSMSWLDYEFPKLKSLRLRARWNLDEIVMDSTIDLKTFLRNNKQIETIYCQNFTSLLTVDRKLSKAIESYNVVRYIMKTEVHHC